MSIFTETQNTRLDSNTFNLSHSVKLSGKAGNLIPCYVEDVLPGDVFNISGNVMVRLAPTIAPVMHRVEAFIHYFFVPNRILWENWNDFTTGGRLGDDATVHPFMELSTTQINNSSLLDYMGLPTQQDVGAGKQFTIQPFAFAAYQKIYDDYYRDNNLTAPIEPQLVDGDNIANTPILFSQRRRSWSKDYFTAALPFTQRGPEALLPLNGTADLVLKDGTNVEQFFRENISPNNLVDTFGVFEDIRWQTPNNQIQTAGGAAGYISVEDSHQVDLSTATSTSILELRRAFALQSWLEKNAVGGSRYNEHIEVIWGVKTSDARIQRAEYIGGFKAPVKMSEVLQTSESNATTPQGNMAGHGIAVGGSRPYTYKSEEHGYIIGILSVMPKADYQQGVARHFRRFDKFDYAIPQFAHIGEQAVENIELWIEGNDSDQETFGYVPRYAEYKFSHNRVAGDYRTNLDFWHLGRKFASQPQLNSIFTEVRPSDMDRIFAVQNGEDYLWMEVFNEVSASRKLPVFGTPKIV